MATVEPFGFTVRECMEWDPKMLRSTDVPTGMWQVYLPHQCDRWMIGTGYRGAAHDEAVALLEAFIAEAQAALVALKDRKEFGEDD